MSIKEKCEKLVGMECDDDATAAFLLGGYYKRQKNDALMVEYYTIAADMDSADAIRCLAEYYFDRAGDEGFANDTTNRLLYKYQSWAYEDNPHDESYNYGFLLENGIGTTPNLRLALKLYEEDYEFGHSQGPRALALHYESVGDEKQSAYWHERADKNVENDYEPEQEIEED